MKKQPNITAKSIREARERIDHMVHYTPVLHSEAISKVAGCDLVFKCENFQKVGAFKARGAANAVLKMSPEERRKGVATHSSGNHAAALARAAQVANIPSYIVMPSSAPQVKRNAVEGYGGIVIECEPNLKAREEGLKAVVNQYGATFIPPYDHIDVVEGQATCALELLETYRSLDFLIAPVGGGGLLAGTALATKFYSPNTKIIGAEPEGANDAKMSFEAGYRIPVQTPNTIADGLLTSLGKLNFEIIFKNVDYILTVSDQEIISAMRLIYERMKIVIEPSSAVPLAVVLKNKNLFANQNVGIILSGGNVDLAGLPFKSS
ncbi:pyridoxal-phosphate dependent enzyme [Cyclobacterium marinum]|uniref:Pyridoxal-5'-phosphate-dependent protein beta subunit n=1 Tax=Cyclobacterium marinum (strain ATCC 25205 / DSM 745 / LMG 13164 / NCIMB 1802) TaxID=880070 RepID=G0IVU5_CYCMS|nr:pyridoxal-phosphate dependent enzyme [Cyclobacterium marinum]AEL24862.1 Pyridoxal-5'-phosphate-dependent protein beta subunit [Cyclobacterium marinum DSM 745]MBI0401662.1 pyridoxal-phosphate dependent enzyme [Cyclobacterium marinum]MBR9775466.1 pyridoxal-phosphate dependent enzyme [Cytophagales bacterium]